MFTLERSSGAFSSVWYSSLGGGAPIADVVDRVDFFAFCKMVANILRKSTVRTFFHLVGSNSILCRAELYFSVRSGTLLQIDVLPRQLISLTEL